MGNSPNPGHQIPAFQVPIPWDEFEASHHSPVCRAASGSIQQGISFQGAGDHTPFDRKEQQSFQEQGQTTFGAGETTNMLQTSASTTLRMHDFDTTLPAAPADGLSSGAPGEHVITIKGGAINLQSEIDKIRRQPRMQNTYASTTECILQNLSMAVGNPSSRCFANAPWRAFTWTCGLLQETHTEPWGTLHAAVQESLELAEAVDIQLLPGLQRLWKKHDLNVQGDANHFVNTLWNLSQSRAFHYR